MLVPRPIRSMLPLLGLAFALLPARLAGQAQATTGVIRGIVQDSATGAILAGASVTLRNVETNAERVLTTNESGVYVATLLRVGTYDVTARALGFQEGKKDQLALRLGETLEVPFSLAPQVVQLQEITVAGEPLVDVTSSESATRLGVEAVQGLPNNGRNIFNFTTLTPNVAIVQGPDGDEISVGGQKGIHNNVSVDGADFNNPFFGEQRGGQRPAFTFNLDAVQDFVVVADGANAEFGRSSGGFINVITKSGTNEFHGSAHYFGKYDDSQRRLPATRSRAEPPPASPPTSPSTSSAPRFGGPIVRDKAFFFLAYDQQEYNDTKQTDRLGTIDPALVALTDTAFGGALQDDFGSISPDQRRQRLPRQARLPAGPEAQRLAQVQLHPVEPAERHIRRGLLGSERQRPRAGPLPCRERQPDLAVLLVALERVPLPVGARGPAPSVRGRDQPGDQPALPRHRRRLRRARRLRGYRMGMPFFIPLADGVRLPVPGAGQRLAAQGQPPVQVRRRVQPHRREPDVPRASPTAAWRSPR